MEKLTKKLNKQSTKSLKKIYKELFDLIFIMDCFNTKDLIFYDKVENILIKRNKIHNLTSQKI